MKRIRHPRTHLRMAIEKALYNLARGYSPRALTRASSLAFAFVGVGPGGACDAWCLMHEARPLWRRNPAQCRAMLEDALSAVW